MKLNEAIRNQLNQFVRDISIKLDRWRQNFLVEALGGMLGAQSVMLSEIARNFCDKSIKLIYREKRLSRNLQSDKWDENQIENQYLAKYGKIKWDTVIGCDIGDLQKKYGRAFQYMARVHDGSEEKIGPGYWLIEVCALYKNGKQKPLLLRVYSQEDPEFLSQPDEVIKAIELVTRHSGLFGIWVFDRGFDDKKLFILFEQKKLRFVVRVRFKRDVLAQGQEEWLSLGQVASKMITPYSHKMWIKNRQTHIYELVSIDFGAVSIRIEGVEKAAQLVVVRGFGKDPMILLTNLKTKKRDQILDIIRKYARRWGCEDGYRFLKSAFDLENIRVLKFRAIKRLILFSMLVFAFLSLLGKASKRFLNLLFEWIEVFDHYDPKFIYYRLARAVAKVFVNSE